MLLTRFVRNIVEKRLFSPTDRLLLAVSGGVDSVVLCDLCRSAGFSFEIAHVNFQLRGEDSVLDECFVKGLAEHYHVPFHLKKADTAGYAESHKVSVQVAARQLRYQWFNELLEKGPRYLLTAHHADDNVETVLMNFFRGTGITGLRGMVAKHDNIVRTTLVCF
jgi:tRNA(Ile)-lysidine synthase